MADIKLSKVRTHQHHETIDVIFDFDNSRHHLLMFHVSDSVDVIINKLKSFAAQIEQDPGLRQHVSDCAVHNEPAYPAGECDCNYGGTDG